MEFAASPTFSDVELVKHTFVSRAARNVTDSPLPLTPADHRMQLSIVAKTRRSTRDTPQDARREPAVRTPMDRLRLALPPGSGVTPWASRPDSAWMCSVCGAQVDRQALAVAKVSFLPWGRRVRWEPAEWRHFVQARILGDEAVAGVESALRLSLEGAVTAVRWNAGTQILEKARGRLTVQT